MRRPVGARAVERADHGPARVHVTLGRCHFGALEDDDHARWRGEGYPEFLYAYT